MDELEFKEKFEELCKNGKLDAFVIAEYFPLAYGYAVIENYVEESKEYKEKFTKNVLERWDLYNIEYVPFIVDYLKKLDMKKWIDTLFILREHPDFKDNVEMNYCREEAFGLIGRFEKEHMKVHNLYNREIPRCTLGINEGYCPGQNLNSKKCTYEDNCYYKDKKGNCSIEKGCPYEEELILCIKDGECPYQYKKTKGACLHE